MIPSLAQVNEAEAPHLGPRGEPVLAASLEMLRERWSAGCRDRETALRVLFLCWYGNIEPAFLTGIESVPDGAVLCEQAYAALGGARSDDPEINYVVRFMVDVCPWCLGDPDHWEAIAPPGRTQGYAKHLTPAHFANRGAYGEYFAGTLPGAGS